MEIFDINTVRLGFLGYVAFRDGEAYRGGLLITDGNGKPVEFRSTTPVKPNVLQRTLYGATMMSHIATELLGVPLLKSVEQKPSVILIRDEIFFGVRSQVETPLFRIEQQQNGTTSLPSAYARTNDEALKSPANYIPIVATPHGAHQDDLSLCKPILKEVFGRMDLYEPFERLENAISYVHENKVLEE